MDKILRALFVTLLSVPAVYILDIEEVIELDVRQRCLVV